VVDGHFRGGRKGEVQYQVDGVTVNNPYDNTSTVRLDRSILEEVQVISGTFDAEYGQAMSGVVNAVLRRGTERLTGSGEVLMGGFLYGPHYGRRVTPELERFFSLPTGERFQPTGTQNYQVTVSGPTGLPKTVFLLSGRQYSFDDYPLAERRFFPTDTSNFQTKVFHPTGDGHREPLGYSREWLGVGKLSNRAIPGVEVTYQAILNRIHGRHSDQAAWAFRLNPDGLSKQRTYSAVHGLEWTQTFGPQTLLKLNLRQNYFDYRDMAYDDVRDPRYAAAGPPRRDPVYELEAFVQGVQDARFVQNTNALVIGGALTRHLSRDHEVKAGIEWQPTYLRFGKPGHLIAVGDTFFVHVNEPPDFPDPAVYRPVIGAAYVQDDLEWNDLKFRAGLRYEYFNSKTGVPSDLANPANAIAEAPPSALRASSRKLTFAPRLGVSYPISGKASLFFAYGHFYQMPLLKDIFTNADYHVLTNYQAESADRGLFGNPDVKPERTVQYQFGYKHALRDWLGLDVTLFYKDIRDLIGIRVLTTYNNAVYRQLSNADFGNVIGMTLALDQRAIGPVSTSLDYTWEVAKGNSSDPVETAARLDAGEDPRPRQAPLNWDQRHTLNLTVTVWRADAYTMSGVLRVASGQPYTPAIETGFGGGLETNSGRKPAAALVDLRAEKRLGAGRLRSSLFARVFNLFDTRYFNGKVFGSSGSPYYSRTLTLDDAIQLFDPTRLYPPRRVELGILWEGGPP
jgi:outer membrane receptor protein involved in Fe transport